MKVSWQLTLMGSLLIFACGEEGKQKSELKEASYELEQLERSPGWPKRPWQMLKQDDYQTKTNETKVNLRVGFGGAAVSYTRGVRFDIKTVSSIELVRHDDNSDPIESLRMLVGY